MRLVDLGAIRLHVIALPRRCSSGRATGASNLAFGISTQNRLFLGNKLRITTCGHAFDDPFQPSWQPESIGEDASVGCTALLMDCWQDQGLGEVNLPVCTLTIRARSFKAEEVVTPGP